MGFLCYCQISKPTNNRQTEITIKYIEEDTIQTDKQDTSVNKEYLYINYEKKTFFILIKKKQPLKNNS